MIIDVHKIAEEGSHFEGEEDAALLELDPALGFEAAGPLHYDLVAQRLPEQVLVTGRVEVAVRARCARCAGFFSTTVADSSFLRDYLLQEGQCAVDVNPDLREAILLELPHFPRCRDACAGLCPQCGRNLNEGTCDCRPPPARGAWAALDRLKI